MESLETLMEISIWQILIITESEWSTPQVISLSFAALAGAAAAADAP